MNKQTEEGEERKKDQFYEGMVKAIHESTVLLFYEKNKGDKEKITGRSNRIHTIRDISKFLVELEDVNGEVYRALASMENAKDWASFEFVGRAFAFRDACFELLGSMNYKFDRDAIIGKGNAMAMAKYL